MKTNYNGVVREMTAAEIEEYNELMERAKAEEQIAEQASAKEQGVN